MKILAQNSVTTKQWVASRVKQEEILKYMDSPQGFIDSDKIERSLSENTCSDKARIQAILDKSLAIQTLSLDETALLLSVTDAQLIAQMEDTAAKVKKKVYDNRIVTFAPLYMSSICVNNCIYCGFRSSNGQIERHKLTQDEVRREIEVLAGKIGHKRLIVVYGEHPESDVNYIAETIKTIYSIEVPARVGTGKIRRLNVNAAPMCIEDLRKLKKVGLGTYQVFQETYHRPTYEKVHPKNTLKGDYLWRLYSMHRSMEAGVDDVGLGALFGLYNWKYEVMGLLSHAIELEKKFNIGPHTISFPRLEPAENTPFIQASPYLVDDQTLKRIITVIRLAIPYTGMIVTAREDAQMRMDALRLGVTQTDASSKIGIGSYAQSEEKQQGKKQQFLLGDTRSLDTVIRELAQMGYITSFCTAGYRCGRTGSKIMDLLRSGTEGKFCKLNAVLTFREWLDDFASSETKLAGEKVIEQEIKEIKEQIPDFYEEFIKSYQKITNGKRDMYF